jgi:hypothetical protein
LHESAEGAAKVRIAWHELDPSTYEDLSAILLSRQHPSSQRVDGSGGDGGRDVQFHETDGLHVFELKSFTGRVTAARRTQIKRSLQRAATLEPVAWTLVVPIDPTPSELKWFDSLHSSFPFPLQWLGKTWLEATLAAYPEITRYFVQRASDEVLELLRELRAEQARPASALDVVERARRLHDRLNELDPHYRYELSLGDEASDISPRSAILSVYFERARVDVYPRYPGADNDRQIRIGVTLAFGSSDASDLDAFLQHIDYGTPVDLGYAVVQRVVIDAPAGLSAAFNGGALTLSARRPEGPPVQVTARIKDGDRLKASLLLELSPTSAGQRGFILEGRDGSGWLRVKLTIDAEKRSFTAKFVAEPCEVLPSNVLPLLRWYSEFRSPHVVVLESSLWSVPAPVRLTNDTAVSPDYLTLVEALETVQRLSGVYFPMAVDLTGAEARTILAARTLLLGEQLEGRWHTPLQVTLTPGEESRRAVRDALARGGGKLLLEREQEIQIRGHVVPLGRIRTIFRSARVGNAELLDPGAVADETAPPLEFIPGEDDRFTRQRVDLGDTDRTLQASVAGDTPGA